MYAEAVALGASGHQEQSQVVKFCCSFLWVSEFAEFQLCCCIFCASALNQVIQSFQRYGLKSLFKLVLLVKPELFETKSHKIVSKLFETHC